MTDSRRPTEADIAALVAGVKAPGSLHRRIQAMVDEALVSQRRSRTRRRTIALPKWRPGAGLAGALAGAAAATAAVLAVGLSGGGSGALTVERAAALTLSPATMAPPPESAINHAQLDIAVQGVSFPYWKERFGWRSAGARIDHVGGREIKTVFYTDAAGRRIGYAIVSGAALSTHGGTVTWREGVPYRLLSQQGATVVVWPRAGHLCAVSGRGLDARTLLRLAWWRGETAA